MGCPDAVGSEPAVRILSVQHVHARRAAPKRGIAYPEKRRKLVVDSDSRACPLGRFYDANVGLASAAVHLSVPELLSAKYIQTRCLAFQKQTIKHAHSFDDYEKIATGHEPGHARKNFAVIFLTRI